jgi:hypothetical protein
MLGMDQTASTQPAPFSEQVYESVVEENPWRKLFYSGTAGVTSATFCAERLSNGAPYQFLRLARTDVTQPPATIGQSSVEMIIASLRPSVAQLAAALGVSRQRVYDWRAGEPMSATSADRVALLIEASRLLHQPVLRDPQILDRKVVGGQSFWLAAADGKNLVELAQGITDFIQRSDRERSALRQSIKQRRSILAGDSALYSESFMPE